MFVCIAALYTESIINPVNYTSYLTISISYPTILTSKVRMCLDFLLTWLVYITNTLYLLNEHDQ